MIVIDEVNAFLYSAILMLLKLYTPLSLIALDCLNSSVVILDCAISMMVREVIFNMVVYPVFNALD